MAGTTSVPSARSFCFLLLCRWFIWALGSCYSPVRFTASSIYIYIGYSSNTDLLYRLNVGEDVVEQIWQNRKTECFAGISWEGLTHETLVKTNCHYLSYFSHSSHVLSTCFTSQEGYSRATRKNFFGFQFALSLHALSLTHTTLTKKSHIKYRVHKIEHNYNQIWYRIKANTK